MTAARSSVCLQKWQVKEATFVKTSRSGVTSFDDTTLGAIEITDGMHRHRSELAEQETAKGLLSHPLPAGAAGGGRHGADPNSKAELILNRGTSCSSLVALDSDG